MKFAIVHPGTMYTQGYTKNDHRGSYLSQTNPIQIISFYFVYLPLATTNPPPIPHFSEIALLSFYVQYKNKCVFFLCLVSMNKNKMILS